MVAIEYNHINPDKNSINDIISKHESIKGNIVKITQKRLEI